MTCPAQRNKKRNGEKNTHQLGKLILANVYPLQRTQPRNRLGQRQQRILAQLQYPQVHQSAEVRRQELHHRVVQIQLLQRDQIGDHLGQLLQSVHAQVEVAQVLQALHVVRQRVEH